MVKVFIQSTQGVIHETYQKVNVSLTSSQVKFIDFVLFHGVKELSESLKLIHDLALYHSDVQLDEIEKIALFDLKLLWECFDRMEEEI